MDEGFCTRCGKRVTFPTTPVECEYSPHCGPFRQENTVPDDVLSGHEHAWHPTGQEG